MRTNYTNLQDLENALSEAMKNFHQTPIEFSGYFYYIYSYIFNEAPHIIDLDSDGKYRNSKFLNTQDEKEEELTKLLTFPNNIMVFDTMFNLAEKFKDKAIIKRYDIFPIIITNNFIIQHYSGYIRIYSSFEYLPKEILDCVVEIKKSNKTFYYVTHTKNGFTTNEMEMRDVNINIDDTYNDDIPHEKIVDFLKSDDSGLILLHGEPGGGKTSYIRHLINNFPDKNFIVMDNSVFSYITDASFINLLMNYKNHTIILEDCEEMIMAKDHRNNNVAALLNLTDGLIGDAFRLKFICTFNTEIKNIDPALMRKGRTKVKYEFKKLNKEKVNKLNKKLKLNLTNISEMTLAELFNHDEDNGCAVKQKAAIGFN